MHYTDVYNRWVSTGELEDADKEQEDWFKESTYTYMPTFFDDKLFEIED